MVVKISQGGQGSILPNGFKSVISNENEHHFLHSKVYIVYTVCHET